MCLTVDKRRLLLSQLTVKSPGMKVSGGKAEVGELVGLGVIERCRDVYQFLFLGIGIR